MSVKNVALDGIKEICTYLEKNKNVMAVLEITYDDNYIADCFAITTDTNKQDLQQIMRDHEEAYGEKWYNIYTIEDGLLSCVSGKDADEFVEKL